MASRVCLGVVALFKSGIRVAGGPALLRRTGKAKPPAPAAPLSALLRLCWGMLGASLQPTEGAGFGLDFGFVFFFSFCCRDSPPKGHHSSTSPTHCFPHFPNRFQLAIQACPAAPVVGMCTKAQRVIANICIQSQNWETLGF